MKILFFICILLIILLLYILFKSFGKNILFTILFSALIIYIILNPKSSILYTINGAKLFFNSVFPSLFPFLVVVNMIFAYDGITIYSRLLGRVICRPLRLPDECSVVLLSSVFCGYPLGARYAAKLYESGTIDKPTLDRLLNIATNGSPLFIIGTVGTVMLHNVTLGYILFFANIVSCIIMGFILPAKRNSSKLFISNTYDKPVAATLSSDVNFGEALKTSLDDAAKTCISIGCFVILFSMIINIIKDSSTYTAAINLICFNNDYLKAIIDSTFLGMIEITNGCSIVSISTLSISLKLCICSFLCGFSGLSITFQVYSFIYKHGISLGKYISLKILQGIISTAITFVAIKLPLNFWTEDVFAEANIVASISPLSFIIPAIVIILLPVIAANILRKDSHNS